jgi:hypothetical protein
MGPPSALRLRDPVRSGKSNLRHTGPYSLETVPLLLLVTQTFAPSKATANGRLPTLSVPNTAPSLTRNFVTVLLPLFVTHGLAFDGASMWVVNYSSNNVMKLAASDGSGSFQP